MLIAGPRHLRAVPASTPRTKPTIAASGTKPAAAGQRQYTVVSITDLATARIRRQ